MSELSAADANADGYLSLDEFKNSFLKAEIQVDRRLLEEIFELLGEKFNKDDTEKVLAFKVIAKRFFDK